MTRRGQVLIVLQAAVLLGSMVLHHSVLAQNVLQVIMQVGDDYKRLQRGRGIIGMDDINNDGWPDLAVGVHTLHQTYIYFGGPGILDTAADVHIQGDGYAVKGDLNGDGRTDYVLTNFSDDCDTLYVYFGISPGPLKIDTVENVRINPENLGDDFGECSVRRAIAVGDLNHDGFDDLVVGARRFGIGGKSYVYLGQSLPTGVPSFTAVGNDTSEHFGYCVGIGDLNGDGNDDLAIASDTRHAAATIDIWYGGPGFTFERNNYAQRFTFATLSPCLDFTLVDFNADGKADLSYSDGYRTYFHFGTTGLLPVTPNFIVVPDSTFYLYNPSGGAIGVGDLNGDGKEDFVIRQAPRNYAFMCLNVYLGNQSPSPGYASGRCKSSVDELTAFRDVVPVGDINGDGVNDFAGTIPYDNQVQYLQDGYFAVFSGDTRWVTGVKSAGEPCPCGFELTQNYPNPFNPSTTFQVSIPRGGHVMITVFDMLGSEVTRLVDTDAEAGDYAYTWDGRNYKGEAVASGSYLCTLRVDDIMIKSIKLLVLR